MEDCTLMHMWQLVLSSSVNSNQVSLFFLIFYFHETLSDSAKRMHPFIGDTVETKAMLVDRKRTSIFLHFLAVCVCVCIEGLIHFSLHV